MSGSPVTYRQVSSAPATVVGGEAAIVTPGDSRLHVLNGVGTRVWELCDHEGQTLEAIVAALVSEFRVDAEQAQQATEAFLKDALERGILTVHTPSP